MRRNLCSSFVKGQCENPASGQTRPLMIFCVRSCEQYQDSGVSVSIAAAAQLRPPLQLPKLPAQAESSTSENVTDCTPCAEAARERRQASKPNHDGAAAAKALDASITKANDEA